MASYRITSRRAEIRWRLPILLGSFVRLAYGSAAVIAPVAMSGRLAPEIHDLPDPRMNLRGFGGALSAIALYTLATARTPEAARSVLWLNVITDTYDTGVSLLELRSRGTVDRVVAGGFAFNFAGLVCWTLAARALRAKS
jgi:hypothetical protein